MNFDVTSINITDWFYTVFLSFLLIVILLLLNILSNKRKEFGDQKSLMLAETKSFLMSDITTVMNKLLNCAKTNDPIFEFKRGIIFSLLKENMHQIFLEEQFEIFNCLNNFKDEYFEYAEKNGINAHFFKERTEQIIKHIKYANSLIDEVKSIKKIKELFAHQSQRENFISRLRKLSKELEEEIDKKEKSE